MKRKLLSVFLAAALALTSAPIISASETTAAPSVAEISNLSTAPTARAVDPLDSQTVYNAMIALKDEYPDGMEWTNDDFYAWNAGVYSGGYGCVAFAFILSDAAFAGLPARRYTTFDPSTVRVGDILRNWGHSYIVLEIHEDYFVIAEGNINESIMWGREIGFDGVADGFEEHLTRYPLEAEPITTETTTETTTAPQTEYVTQDVKFGLDIIPPDKEFYRIGEDLDLSGMTAEVWYNISYMNGDEVLGSEADRYEVSVDSLEITGFSSADGGTCRVNVAYETIIPSFGWARMENGFLVNIVEETTEPTTDTTYPTWGNVNGDEKIDASDAAEVLVAAAAVGSGEASGLTKVQETYADVDESGSFNAADAALILQYATYIGTGGTKALKDYLAELE